MYLQFKNIDLSIIVRIVVRPGWLELWFTIQSFGHTSIFASTFAIFWLRYLARHAIHTKMDSPRTGPSVEGRCLVPQSRVEH